MTNHNNTNPSNNQSGYNTPNNKPVLAANTWKDNGHLIADVAKLGFVKATDRVADVTYGRGIWWQQFRPTDLTTHDIRLDGIDFRHLPEADGWFDVVAYDPPYVATGGRGTTGIPDFNDRYGLHGAPKSPELLQNLIDSGVQEVFRVLRTNGLALIKCQNYVSSGQLWPGAHLTHRAALKAGFVLTAEFHHVSPAPRPQPPGRRQLNPRSNVSTLYVLRKPRPRKACFKLPVTQLVLPGMDR